MLRERVIQRRVVFHGRYLCAEEQTVVLPDGTEAIREIVSPPDAVGILPVDERGIVYLVRQYRPAIQQVTLEIPAGVIDHGEDPMVTACRECEEEVRMRPGRMEPMCSFYHSVGFSTGKISLVLARDLTPSEHCHHEPGEFLEVMTLPFEELYSRVMRGEIIDSKTLIATLWYQQRVRDP